jgi:pimeloyl-ACP methyl ester carboxylesterase
MIWGERDRYLVPALTEGLEQWVPNLRVERLPGSSHWVMQDEPRVVNDLLTGFVS